MEYHALAPPSRPAPPLTPPPPPHLPSSWMVWSSCSSISVSPNPRNDIANAIDGSTSTWSWITQSDAAGLQTISCAISAALPIAGLRITRGDDNGFQPLSVRFSVDGTPVTGFAHSCDGSSSASTVLQNPTAIDFHLVGWSTSNGEVCTFDWSPATGSAVEVAFDSAVSLESHWAMAEMEPRLLSAPPSPPRPPPANPGTSAGIYDDPHLWGAHGTSPCVGIHE